MKIIKREVTIICDICGAILRYEPNPYKVKVKKIFCGKWKQLDICPDCQGNIIDYCTQKKKEKEL